MTTTIPPPPPAPDTEEIPPTDPAPATLAPARVPSLPDWPSEAVTAVECPHPHPTTDRLSFPNGDGYATFTITAGSS